MTDRTNRLYPGQFSNHRTIKGTPVAADAEVSSTFPNRRGMLNTDGYQEIMVRLELDGGTTPTATLQVLGYDESADSFSVLGTMTAVSSCAVDVIPTYGLRVFLRLSAVTGSPTEVRIRVAPATADLARE